MAMESENDVAAPLDLVEGEVWPEWIDYNGHMNVAYYLLAFDQAYDAFLLACGLDREFRDRTGGSTFAAETHLRYLRELKEGEPYRVTGHLLASDGKRMHVFLRMYSRRSGDLAATMEGMNLYVDLSVRKVVVMPEEIRARVAAIQRRHARLPRPVEAGRGIAMPERPWPGGEEA